MTSKDIADDNGLYLQTRNLASSPEDFVQSLFASALDCLEIDLRPRHKAVEIVLEDEEANANDQTNSQNPEAQNGSPSLGPSEPGQGQESQKAKNGDPKQAGSIPKGDNLSIDDLIASDSDEEMTQQMLEEEAHLAKVMESLQGKFWSTPPPVFPSICVVEWLVCS